MKCPHCEQAMDLDPLDSDKVICPKCFRRMDRVKVSRYWRSVPTGNNGAASGQVMPFVNMDFGEEKIPKKSLEALILKEEGIQGLAKIKADARAMKASNVSSESTPVEEAVIVEIIEDVPQDEETSAGAAQDSRISVDNGEQATSQDDRNAFTKEDDSLESAPSRSSLSNIGIPDEWTNKVRAKKIRKIILVALVILLAGGALIWGLLSNQEQNSSEQDQLVDTSGIAHIDTNWTPGAAEDAGEENQQDTTEVVSASQTTQEDYGIEDEGSASDEQAQGEHASGSFGEAIGDIVNAGGSDTGRGYKGGFLGITGWS